MPASYSLPWWSQFTSHNIMTSKSVFSSHENFPVAKSRSTAPFLKVSWAGLNHRSCVAGHRYPLLLLLDFLMESPWPDRLHRLNLTCRHVLWSWVVSLTREAFSGTVEWVTLYGETGVLDLASTYVCVHINVCVSDCISLYLSLGSLPSLQLYAL